MKRKITVRIETAEKAAFLPLVEQRFQVKPVSSEDAQDDATMLCFEVERGNAFDDFAAFLEEQERQRPTLEYTLEEETAVTLTLDFMEAKIDIPYDYDGKEIFQVALEGVQLLANLGDASEHPFYYLELERPPALLFPVRNKLAGITYWMEILPSATGLFVCVHREKPTHKNGLDQSPQTAMAMVHVEAHLGDGSQTRHVVRTQLWSGVVYGDPSWTAPDGNEYHGASIILVKDVAAWEPPQIDRAGSSPSHEAPRS